jgi:hypothetical protein
MVVLVGRALRRTGTDGRIIMGTKRPSLLRTIVVASALLFAATGSIVGLMPSAAHAAPGDLFANGGGIDGHWIVGQRTPGGDLVGFTTTQQLFASPVLQSRNFHLFISSGAPYGTYRLRISDRTNSSVYADTIGTLDGSGFVGRIVGDVSRSACDRPLRIEVTLGGTQVGPGVVSGGVTTYSDTLTDYCGPMIAMSAGGVIGDGFTPGGQVQVQTWVGSQLVTASDSPLSPTLVRSSGMSLASFAPTRLRTVDRAAVAPTPGRITTTLTGPCINAFPSVYSATDLATNVTVENSIRC